MPIIKVEMFSGRTLDQKRAIAKELTDGFVRAVGGSPDAVQVVMSDVDKSDWARGGVLNSDN